MQGKNKSISSGFPFYKIKIIRNFSYLNINQIVNWEILQITLRSITVSPNKVKMFLLRKLGFCRINSKPFDVYIRFRLWYRFWIICLRVSWENEDDVYLDSLRDVLHPLALLSARGRRHHQRPLSVVNIETELRSHSRLAVDNLITKDH